MNTTGMSSKERDALKKLRAQVLADYEEQRRQVVAESFGPILDDILANDTDKTSTTWPKIWSPISPTKIKFTRLTSP